MSLEADLFTRLSTHDGLVALVGQRIYPLVIPQKVAMPAVRYQRVAVTHTSAMGVDAPLTTTLVQVSSHADTFDGARAVAVQVRAALQRWMDDDVGVQDVYVESEIDLYDQADLEGGYQVATDFRFWHMEA